MAAAKSPSSKTQKLVLVVDDDASIRDMVVKALTPQYRVVTADDGLVASEMLGDLRPDLLICDVMMPRVDGFSLARMIRSHPELDKMPIIFVTAKTTPQAMVQGIQLGARHYVQKPFSVRELLDKVGKLLQ